MYKEFDIRDVQSESERLEGELAEVRGGMKGCLWEFRL
jgi:hypothetical protein